MLEAMSAGQALRGGFGLRVLPVLGGGVPAERVAEWDRSHSSVHCGGGRCDRSRGGSDAVFAVLATRVAEAE